MLGVTKHIYNSGIMHINVMWNNHYCVFESAENDY